MFFLLRFLPVGKILAIVGVVLLVQLAGVDLLGMGLDALGLSDPFGWLPW